MTTVDPVRDADEHQVRLTEREALANVRTVLELCAAGKPRCSDKTSHPTAATMRTINAHLAHGDGYVIPPDVSRPHGSQTNTVWHLDANS